MLELTNGRGRIMTTTSVKRIDCVFRNARLIDGLGNPSLQADIAVADDRIVAIGGKIDQTAPIEIDARGKVVAPGFIDAHTHDDHALLAEPLMPFKVSQGVTSVITGNCGISLGPLSTGHRPPAPIDLVADDPEHFFPTFGAYLNALDNDPAAVNAACQVGHSTLRVAAMDRLDRAAGTGEIKFMRGGLEEALDAGAIGLSTGLYYPPASAAPTEEVIELAKSLAGALHTTHMRDEADGIAQSLEETFAIGREADVPIVISHHKCAGLRNHGRSHETLEMIDHARAGQSIGLDVYPYAASSTMLDPGRVNEVSKIIVTGSATRPDVAGRDLDDIAAEMGCDRVEAAQQLLPAGAVFFAMDEADVQRILAYPHTMIGSDGLPKDNHPHPRLWGTFPRVLGHYARDTGLFSLEEAVRRMTSLPAARFGLVNRGVVRPGAFADLVLFDPDTVIDRATFENPTLPAAGIELVMVNGTTIWRDGTSTGARPGRTLRRQELGPLGAEAPQAQ
jgi:N-acyl-D-amino-acid deacylase